MTKARGSFFGRAATPESSAYIRIQSGEILAPDRPKSGFESGFEVSTQASQPYIQYKSINL